MKKCNTPQKGTRDGVFFRGGSDSAPLLPKAMNSLSHLAAIQADREIQHWGYGVEKRDGKWFAYEWERESELSIRTQLISPPFNQEWEAEQFLISLKAR